MKKMTPEAAASCDPDYGWINGPEGTNKCYYILRDQEITNCGLSYGMIFSAAKAAQEMLMSVCLSVRLSVSLSPKFF